MKVTPIIFSGEMIRALLDGCKTQTRRPIKPKKSAEGILADPNEAQDLAGELMDSLELQGFDWQQKPDGRFSVFPPCPYGKPGDLLYVRETYSRNHSIHVSHGGLLYRADALTAQSHHGQWAYFENGEWLDFYRRPMKGSDRRWRPSIHMPRWASRLTLELTDVRFERLQDISEEDAKAEGITDGGCLECGNPEPCGCDSPSPDATDSFAWFWMHTGGDWHANPWVWALTFNVHQVNIDEYLRGVK